MEHQLWLHHSVTGAMHADDGAAACGPKSPPYPASWRHAALALSWHCAAMHVIMAAVDQLGSGLFAAEASHQAELMARRQRLSAACSQCNSSEVTLAGSNWQQLRAVTAGCLAVCHETKQASGCYTLVPGCPTQQLISTTKSSHQDCRAAVASLGPMHHVQRAHVVHQKCWCSPRSCWCMR
jgi:hypothetical protein